MAPTVGPAHGGFEFLKGNFEGLKGYVVGRMTKSRRGKLYIDDAGWGPEAGSIEYGYRVPFGGIHIFVGKIGEPGPEPDICTDLVEMAQRASPARIQPAMKRAFMGCVHGIGSEPVSEGETVAYSNGESSAGETESLYQVRDGVFKGIPMAPVFQNSLNRRTTLGFSWPEHSQPCETLLRRCLDW